jgi:hypothetical protein
MLSRKQLSKRRDLMKLLEIIVFVFGFLTPMSPAEPARDRETYGETRENFEKSMPPLMDAIAKSKPVALLEGLPHQLYEDELLAKELKQKKTIKLHEFPFYVESTVVNEKEAKQLRDIFSNSKNFKRFEIPKPCGGFHPDWCVVFTVDKEIYRALVCFGCHEARIYGPKNEVLTDLDEPAYKQLVAILKPNQKLRPKAIAKE